MKQKLFTQGVTIFLRPDMFEQVKQESDSRQCSISELVRTAISCFFDALEELNQKELEAQRRYEEHYKSQPSGAGEEESINE